MAKTIGYARVAVVPDNDLDDQVAALKAAGCEAVLTDMGTSPGEGLRPGLQEALAALSAGDTLLVRDISRLSRNMGEMADIRALLDQRAIHLATVEKPEPAEACGRFVFAASTGA